MESTLGDAEAAVGTPTQVLWHWPMLEMSLNQTSDDPSY